MMIEAIEDSAETVYSTKISLLCSVAASYLGN